MEKFHLLTAFQTSVRFSEQFLSIEMRSLYYLVLHNFFKKAAYAATVDFYLAKKPKFCLAICVLNLLL